MFEKIKRRSGIEKIIKWFFIGIAVFIRKDR